MRKRVTFGDQRMKIIFQRQELTPITWKILHKMLIRVSEAKDGFPPKPSPCAMRRSEALHTRWVRRTKVRSWMGQLIMKSLSWDLHGLAPRPIKLKAVRGGYYVSDPARTSLQEVYARIFCHVTGCLCKIATRSTMPYKRDVVNTCKGGRWKELMKS